MTAAFGGSLREELERRPARRLRAGEYLYHVGEAASAVYWVREGLIKTSMVAPDGQVVTLRMHQAGDMLGELCLSLGERPDQAVGLAESAVVEIPVPLLIARFRRDPDAALDFASAACAHLGHAYERLHSLAVESAIDRLARTLLDLAADLGEGPPSRTRLSYRITQEELARLISARREVVSGLLNQLRSRDCISYGRRGRIMVDCDALRTLLARSGQV
ncbi:MAG TPA: Crp/Fnr family transcriptional regulator [Gemmatimonadales bacterium]|nr:Crp/Fnr family transcriptional regulator [Gemmatimonadales bacterium]